MFNKFIFVMVLTFILAVVPIISAQSQSTCTFGRDVDRSFFEDLLTSLRFQISQLAIKALQAWQREENTKACWNPLATTQRMPGSWGLAGNPAGVQEYPDAQTGIEATKRTLTNGYYSDILKFLSQESFDKAAIERNLNTWSGSGGYVSRLSQYWEKLWYEQDRALIRAQGDIKVFWYQNGQRYHVLSPDILNAMAGMSGWSWNQIIELSWDEISRIPEGPAFIAPDYRSEGILIRKNGTDPVYRVENGRLRHISYDECVQANCWSDIIDVTPAIMDLFQLPPDIITVNLFAGWNMISPVGGDFSIQMLLASSDCTLTDGPWWYNGIEYEQPSVLEPDKGYWVEMAASCTASFPRGPVLQQTSQLHSGWNMISVVAEKTSLSGCEIASGPWWYNGYEYIQSSILEPTKGYWVYVDNSCLTGLSHGFKKLPLASPPPPPPSKNDDDGDGVPNDKDKCPGTPKGTPVGPDGCPTTGTKDDDGDGVPNNQDQCPGTPKGTPVDVNGCPRSPSGLVAAFTYSPQNPKPGEVITFDCSPSRDPDGSIVSCRWDFGGQGTHVSEQGKQHQHKFDREGTYTVTLTVKDNTGAESSTSQTISVRSGTTPGPGPGPQPPSPGPGPSKQLPVASFTYSPQNPKPGEVITFDCSPSQASANKKISSCDWDFHNQGAFVAELKNLRQHKFDSEGYFTVTLTVKDDTGAESNPTSKVITVSKTPVKDRDGDGVRDSEDQCPDQPGSVDNKGCPVTPTETLTSAVDSNRSSYIEDDEMLRVLDAWIKSKLFAGKFTVRESDVISLLSKWARHEKLPETPNPNSGLTSCTISILDPLPLTGRLIGGLLWDEGTLWNSGMARSQSDIGYSLYRIDTKTGEVVPPAPLTVKAQAPLDNVIIFGGITWNGRTLVGAEHTGGIHFLNRSGARVGIWPRISTSYLNIEAVQDITWDGKAIWLLVKARPANDKQAKGSMYLLKLNDTGDVAQWFSISESGVEGMVWDGKSFWMTDAQKDQLYQINAEGKITRVCSAPRELRAPRGIAWDGTSFWVLSTSKMKIYKVAIK